MIKCIGLHGIDEISLRKGYQDFMTIITSLSNDKMQILAVLKGREKSIIKGFLSAIPKK
jgi:transposase